MTLESQLSFIESHTRCSGFCPSLLPLSVPLVLGVAPALPAGFPIASAPVRAAPVGHARRARPPRKPSWPLSLLKQLLSATAAFLVAICHTRKL
jgi:hypothetical protein